MARREVKAVEYTCDGCNKRHYEIEGEPPDGISIDWFEVSSTGGTGGRIWVDSQSCALRALRERHNIIAREEGKL